MTIPTRPRRRAAGAVRAGVAVLALALLTAPTAAFAQDGDDDPNLDQTLGDLAVVHGDRTLDAGHVDMGPKFDDGQWTFLIHDDVAKADANATSVWRYPEETVFHVLDQAELSVPDDPAYVFVGADPGATVWVVPQTQNPEVVWLGWNTQDPEVMQTIDRGVTLSLTGAQGPGTVTTYLQSGSFGEPQLLWDSRVPDAQPIWVDVNTHTHANWVFTEPGVYLLQLEATADLVDGSTVSNTQLIRFAVGTDTSPADALAATWAGAAAAAPGEGADAEDMTLDGRATAAPEPAGDPLVPILIGAIGLVAVALVVGLVVVIVRGKRAKQRALASRAEGGDRDRDRVSEDAR
ncbi:choice-of-anchor M domain-containing protein [uncultured Microbacterium sp.]|uniref:choice-of-anchor M domain-containing protein n=1 Tax=uncultured Microbacterium sp. TaxID=191216 RepID=UPI0028D52365|nr:choice-of-anchor M domain-containing protein [uncultured Microbacterium sp.]